MERRGLVKGALILGGAWAIVARPWNWGRAPELEFEPFDPVPGFRRLSLGGQVTGGGLTGGGAGGAVLLGLDASPARDAAVEARVRAEVEPLLWSGWTGGAPVPVTYFTDIRCPLCRLLEPRLATLEGITLTTREYPLFGAASELAARAVLAAGRQGAAEAMRERLHRTRAVSGADALGPLAEGLGLDGGQFRADLDGAEVAARLAEDRALAGLFGLPGTPSLIIGRTRVVGVQPDAVLRAVIADEALARG
ncbi:DsbA family protein [Gymnodinialimonas ulvae]|uniref:DsbA family protein n=1 Tax=Gymnodinialimonas ulvae TaxID=3126504 RepID=UPI0030A9CE9F